METLNLNVASIHCNSCKLTIEESLEELAGVAASAVDLATKHVTVAYDPDTVDPAAITATIEQAGYPVTN
jgi:copper chaperone CopZ